MIGIHRLDINYRDCVGIDKIDRNYHIAPGSYPPQSLSQGERQELWQYFGHSGEAPVGYGGEGGGGGGGSTFPSFAWTPEQEKAAYTAALEELRPYYERILSEEKGDVERAKKRMEEDYTRGARYRTEDLADVQRQSLRDQQALVETLNKRGVLQSTIRTGEEEDLRLRQEAVKRALGRQEEEAGLTKGRGLEDITVQAGRREFLLGEEKKEKTL